MIVHKGVRYWTTRDLVASLEARGLVSQGGSLNVRLRRAQRWARRMDLRPSAKDVFGGFLWGEDETREALGLDNGA